MKTAETDYDEYGWKLKVRKSKGDIQIYLRSKGGYHRNQKPFYLRLNKENMEKLKLLLKDVGEELA